MPILPDYLSRLEYPDRPHRNEDDSYSSRNRNDYRNGHQNEIQTRYQIDDEHRRYSNDYRNENRKGDEKQPRNEQQIDHQIDYTNRPHQYDRSYQNDQRRFPNKQEAIDRNYHENGQQAEHRDEYRNANQTEQRIERNYENKNEHRHQTKARLLKSQTDSPFNYRSTDKLSESVNGNQSKIGK